MVDYVFDFDNLLDNDLYEDPLIFSETSQLCSHNAFASMSRGFDEHSMQYLSVENQFYAGARCFMIDVYEIDSELVLLHNKNLQFLDGIGKGKSYQSSHYKFEEFLTTIGTLLKGHSKSIITLIIENEADVTHDKIKNSLDKLDLYKYTFDKNPNDHYLSFGEIRSADKRLLVFTGRGTKSPSINIFDTSYYKETTYSLGDDKNCIDREEGRVKFSDTSVNLFVLNHFYKFSCNHPSKSILAKTLSTLPHLTSDYKSCDEVNAYKEIEDRVNQCKAIVALSTNPTYIAVDFMEKGNDGGALKVVTDLVDKEFYPKLKKVTTADSGYFGSISISGTLYTFTIFGAGVFAGYCIWGRNTVKIKKD